MEKETLQLFIKKALQKKELLDRYPSEYWLRALMGGFFCTLVVIVTFKVGNGFHEIHSPVAYPISALIFGLFLVIIQFTNTELFTGNTMYFTFATLNKNTTWKDTLRNWVACYLGNFLGACLVAYLFYLTGIFSHITPDHFIHYVSEAKMSASTSQLFFKGILCNWLVCLALFLGGRTKSDGAKIFLTITTVFCFFAAGYEHSVANMSIFSVALLSPHPDTVSLAGALHNLIPVTLGNIVGGAGFMGMLFYYVNRRQLKQSDTQHTQQSA